MITPKSILTLAGGAWLLLVNLSRADVRPAALFQDHTVLQAGKPLPVWGWADAAEKITVRFAGQSAETTAGPDGTWRVTLAPLAVSRVPAELIMAGKNTVVVKDVLVGQVWLCSGQSNMERLLSQVASADAEIAAAHFPLIRHFQVRRKISNAPEPAVEGHWAVCTQANAGGFTAVGYFFARELTQKLGVPVGIINSSWGGTDIEGWLSPASLAQNPEFRFVGERWQKELEAYPANQAKYDAFESEEERKLDAARSRGLPYVKRWHSPVANPDGSPHPNKASNLYNGMIHGLIPAAISGVLWYQGENNVGRADEYRRLFPALISGWRDAFGQGNLPFYWVQLPNFHGNPGTDDWAVMREAQSSALILPATGQAITIDVGEVEDIHPHNKADVGHRLALLALHEVYGETGACSGPKFAGATFVSDMATVRFSELAGGLVIHGPILSGFELAGSDHVLKPAEARINGATVEVRSADVPRPVAVRYAWHNAPAAALFNQAGLPAAPFRSDEW